MTDTARSFVVELSRPCHLEDEIEDEINTILEWVVDNTLTWNVYRDLAANSSQLSFEYYPRYCEDWVFQWHAHHRYPMQCRARAWIIFTFESHSDQVQFLLRWKPADA